jgi:uncharacterized LabA/DUF88 family protein
MSGLSRSSLTNGPLSLYDQTGGPRYSEKGDLRIIPVGRQSEGLREGNMNTDRQSQNRFAVLIDADNAQPSITEGLLAEVAKYGVASVKRAYGDWTTSSLGGWKPVLLEHSIQPIQQFRYTVGKNATDTAMVIDAMDLLYTGRFEGFCLVSSDSDFTRLACRIREEGVLVYGFGEKKTPKPFVSACDKFIFTEVLRFQEDAEPATKPKTGQELKGDTKLVSLLRSALEAASDESGWGNLGTVGNNIVKQAPEFDPRNYGYSKLRALAEATNLFEFDKRPQSDGHSAVIYIRDKRKKMK